MDIVPGIVNRAAHLIFYILMDLEILITALYMYDQTVGLSKQNRKKNLLLLVPGVISLVLTVAGIGQIYYVQGKMTNYSMGMSAYVCFATLFFYYGIILYLLVARHRFLPKEKKLGTASMIVIVGTILIVQIIYPEVLLTSVAAPLHDLGKIATPDRILQKPGKLTDEEFAIMKEHAARGGEIILNTFKNIDNPEFQQIAYEVARFHHEKYNGKGYPDGLAGEQIPLHARVMAIADVFDAVSQKRCYRDAMPVDQCFEIIEKGSGTDFDPHLTKLFLESRNEIEQLMERD